MDFDKAIQETHKIAKEKGWWETERSPKELLTLVHSEISEATEEARSDRPPIYQYSYLDPKRPQRIELGDPYWERGAPVYGEAVEIMDASIRVMDLLGSLETPQIFKKNRERVFTLGSEIRKENPLEVYFIFHDMISKSYQFSRNTVDSRILCSFLVATEEYFSVRNWSFDFVYQAKKSYNEKREYRHGGKKY